MSNVYAVDTERIAAASGDIQRIAGQIEGDVRAMMSRLHGLQDCWRGSAAASFSGVTQEWSATQEKVREALNQISLALRTAGQDYAAVEDHNRLRFTPQ